MYQNLYKKLIEYSESDFYPFHMPGHKRNKVGESILPYQMDITEINGFDDLHHPEGILKESMEWASDLYQSGATWYLVNGSSCGILASVSAAMSGDVKKGTPRGEKILVAENCHKSVFHAVELNRISMEILEVKNVKGREWKQGVLAENVEDMLLAHSDCQAVVITSPTYEGYVSDIRSISKICHERNCILIVDEAHGAHFCFHERFPESALYGGADLVIQSLHKTLPSLTQTAVLHMSKEAKVLFPWLEKKVKKYLSVFQSSSPSYLLMASVEECLNYMKEKGKEKMEDYIKRMDVFYEKMEKLKHLEVILPSSDRDLSKVMITWRCRDLTFPVLKLNDIFRNKYHLEMEMCGRSYVLAMTSCMDTEPGMNRLGEALLEIDEEIEKGFHKYNKEITGSIAGEENRKKTEQIKQLTGFAGKSAEENVYVYPPGIPIVRKGEEFTMDKIEEITTYLREGFCVYGI